MGRLPFALANDFRHAIKSGIVLGRSARHSGRATHSLIGIMSGNLAERRRPPSRRYDAGPDCRESTYHAVTQLPNGCAYRTIHAPATR